MPATRLRKVGGSVMMSVPPAILDELHLKAGSSVGLAVENGRLVVHPERKPHYTLDALLADYERTAGALPDDKEWLESAPQGGELL